MGCAFIFSNDFLRGSLAAFLLFMVPAIIVGFLQQKHFRYYALQGGLLQIILCLQGYLMLNVSRENLCRDHFTRFKGDWCELMLTEDPSHKGTKLRAVAEVIRIGNGKEWIATSGKVLCYFPPEDSAAGLFFKTQLISPFNIQAINEPRNPGEFNYRLFMERRQVYAGIPVKHYRLTEHSNDFSIRKAAFACRSKLIDNLRKQLGEGQEYAVAAALLIGEDDFVDQPLMQAFTATGTLHVLSVSGMHVGLIYMLLAALLGRLENKKGWRTGYFILLYGFLWSYAMITGLSAPVVRSAMMLSLVLSGKLLERKSPVLNTLAGSFFLLMVINPFWITETGFQLSYLAVFGIMALHPMLLKQLEVPNIWLHRIWELVSVSLCAQIITFPVSLYYFGQFPNYFLISNLIIIPVSTLAIYGGIIMMITGAIPVAGYCIATIECYLLKILNGITIFLGELPFAISNTGKISVANCILLYIMFYCMIRWLQARDARSLKIVLVSAITWSLLIILRL